MSFPLFFLKKKLYTLFSTQLSEKTFVARPFWTIWTQFSHLQWISSDKTLERKYLGKSILRKKFVREKMDGRLRHKFPLQNIVSECVHYI